MVDSGAEETKSRRERVKAVRESDRLGAGEPSKRGDRKVPENERDGSVRKWGMGGVGTGWRDVEEGTTRSEGHGRRRGPRAGPEADERGWPGATRTPLNSPPPPLEESSADNDGSAWVTNSPSSAPPHREESWSWIDRPR